MFSTGALVRLARQYRGMDQQSLISAVGQGLSAPTLSRIENGAIDVPDPLKERIARAVNFPISFFNQAQTVYGSPMSVHLPMWRKRANVPANEVARIVAEANLRVFHLRSLLESADLETRLSLPTFDVETNGSPQQIANLLRRHWLLPEGPIDNLVRLVEDAGIVVCRSSMGGSQISGLTYRVPGLPPVVILNRDETGDRQRLTLAHELGHIVMHSQHTPDMEREAWEFASEFLVPANELHRSIAGRNVDLRTLSSLKKEWKVSMASLLTACSRNGFVREATTRYLWIEFGRRNIRFREPPELDVPVEQTSVVQDLIQAYRQGLNYSQDDICFMFNMNPEDVATLYEEAFRDPKPARPYLRVVR